MMCVWTVVNYSHYFLGAGQRWDPLRSQLQGLCPHGSPVLYHVHCAWAPLYWLQKCELWAWSCSCRWDDAMSLNCGHQCACSSSPRRYMGIETHGVIILTGRNQITWRKSCLSVTLSTSDPTRTDLGASSGPCGEMLATNRLSYDTASRGHCWSTLLQQWLRITLFHYELGYYCCICYSMVTDWFWLSLAHLGPHDNQLNPYWIKYHSEFGS
jgi:hypothetical protein